jgi:Domain of unknown function (DUF1330)
VPEATQQIEATMSKGYWIARVTVADPVKYKLYAEGTAPALKAYGAKVLARGGKYEALEGEARPRNVDRVSVVAGRTRLLQLARIPGRQGPSDRRGRD